MVRPSCAAKYDVLSSRAVSAARHCSGSNGNFASGHTSDRSSLLDSMAPRARRSSGLFGFNVSMAVLSSIPFESFILARPDADIECDGRKPEGRLTSLWRHPKFAPGRYNPPLAPRSGYGECIATL